MTDTVDADWVGFDAFAVQVAVEASWHQGSDNSSDDREYHQLMKPRAPLDFARIFNFEVFLC